MPNHPKREPKTCTICDREHHAKGYCQWHYNRWYLHGNPMTSKPHNKSIIKKPQERTREARRLAVVAVLDERKRKSPQGLC